MVTIKNSHICCGGCVTAAEEALDGLDGVSKAIADTNSKTIAFDAADARAASRGVAALAKAGFFGKAEFQGKALAFPQAKLKKGTKASQFKIEGLHLCCTACVTGAQTCLQDVPGVKLIDIDRSEKTIAISGADIPLAAAIKALQDGGFYGQIQKDAKKEKK